MITILSIISLILLIALIVGMVNPSLVIRWGNEEDKTRKNVIKIYFITMLAFFVFIEILKDGKKAQNVSSEDQVKEVVSKENDESVEKKESQVDKEKEEGVEKKENAVDKEKEESEEEKKEDTKAKKEDKAFIFDHEYVTSWDSRVNSELAAKYFIEEYDKQRVKKVKIKSVSIYSNNPVRDQSGKEYPYSTMVIGRYEEKNTGALRDFIMTLVYDNLENVEKGFARCTQYFNDDTGTYINKMHEEDDAILKLIEALE